MNTKLLIRDLIWCDVARAHAVCCSYMRAGMWYVLTTDTSKILKVSMTNLVSKLPVGCLLHWFWNSLKMCTVKVTDSSCDVILWVCVCETGCVGRFGQMFQVFEWTATKLPWLQDQESLVRLLASIFTSLTSILRSGGDGWQIWINKSQKQTLNPYYC